MILVWCVLLYYSKEVLCYFPEMHGEDYESAQLLLKLTTDVVGDTNRRIGLLSDIKQACERSASFEVGYLTYTVIEKYRRMVDKYHTTVSMIDRYFYYEFILMLEDVENHYWEIEHIANMMHEIEHKYWIKSGLNDDYVGTATTTTPSVATRPVIHQGTRSKKKKKHFKILNHMLSRLSSTTTKRPVNKWWPIDYGWEIDYYW